MLRPEQQELARRAAHHEARTAEQEAAERAERLEDRAFVLQREGKGRTHQAVLEDAAAAISRQERREARRVGWGVWGSFSSSRSNAARRSSDAGDRGGAP